MNEMDPNFAYIIDPKGNEFKIPENAVHWAWIAKNTNVKNEDDLYKKNYITIRGDAFRCNDLPSAEDRIVKFVQKHFRELPEECMVSEFILRRKTRPSTDA